MALNDQDRYADTFSNVEPFEASDEIRSWPEPETILEMRPDCLIAIDRAISEREMAIRSSSRHSQSLQDLDIKLKWNPPKVLSKPSYYSFSGRQPDGILDWFVSRLCRICTKFIKPDYDPRDDDFGYVHHFIGTESSWTSDGRQYSGMRYSRKKEKAVNNGTGKTNPYRFWTWSDLVAEEGCSVLTQMKSDWTYVTDPDAYQMFVKVYVAFKKVLSKLYALPLGTCINVAGGNRYGLSGSSGYDPANPTAVRPGFSTASSAWDDAVSCLSRWDSHTKDSESNRGRKSIAGTFGFYDDRISVGTFTKWAESYYGWTDDYFYDPSVEERYYSLVDTGKRKANPYGSLAIEQGDIEDFKTTCPGVSSQFSWSIYGRWSHGYDTTPGFQMVYGPKVHVDRQHASASVDVSGVKIDFISVWGCKNGKAPVLHYRVSNGFADFVPSLPTKGYTGTKVSDEGYTECRGGTSTGNHYLVSYDNQYVAFVPYGDATRDPKHFVEKTIQLSASGKLTTPICHGPSTAKEVSSVTPPALRSLGDIVSYTKTYSDGESRTYSCPIISSNSYFSTSIIAYRFWCDYSKVFDFM